MNAKFAFSTQEITAIIFDSIDLPSEKEENVECITLHQVETNEELEDVFILEVIFKDD